MYEHTRGQCQQLLEQFTLPAEFVELWGEIGKAHAAACCYEEYTPRKWARAELQAAKLAGLAKKKRQIHGTRSEGGLRDLRYDYDGIAIAGAQRLRDQFAAATPVTPPPGLMELLATPRANAPPTLDPPTLTIPTMRWSAPVPYPQPAFTWSLDDDTPH